MIDRNSFEPLYLQVKNDIIAAIEDGRIKIGDKLMSENEMLQYYGVGRMTIRSALSELVAEGCLKKEQGLGSFCVAYPQRMQRLNIDVLINSGDIYFIPHVLKGISRVLEQNSCNLLLHDTKNSQACIRDLLEDILRKGTDGVLLQPNTLPEDNAANLQQVLKQYQRAKVPIVAFCGSLLSNDCISLTIDDQYGACIAAQYLLDCGHRRILGLFPGFDYCSALRMEGFEQIMSAHPETAPCVIYRCTDYASRMLQAVREGGVTAIQCCNDRLAVECLRLLSEENIRVPDDVSLIGYDNTELSLSTIPQLTTIAHPKDHLGSDAAQSLLLLIRAPGSKQGNVVYRPELVIRQSVRQLSAK